MLGLMLFTDSRKWFLLACLALISSSRAFKEASLTTKAISAPLNPVVNSANSSAETSSAQGTFASVILNISFRASRSGGGTYKILSILPGRNRALSYTVTFSINSFTNQHIWPIGCCHYCDIFQWFNPVHFNQQLAQHSVDHTNIITPDPSQCINFILDKWAKLWVEYTKKIIEGAAARAFLKTLLIAFSDSPTHLLKS